MEVKFVLHKGKNILFLDLANSKKTEVFKAIEEAREIIKTQQPHSIVMLTNITNVKFDKDIKKAFREFADHNKPYTKVSVVMGLNWLQRIFYNAVIKLSEKNIPTFDDSQKAMDWLVKQ